MERFRFARSANYPWFFAAILAVLAACMPDLPGIAGSGASSPGGPDAGPSISLRIEPSGSLESAPAVLRLHVAVAGETLDPSRIALVQGAVTASQLGQVAKTKVSAALQKRIAPAIAFLEADGGVVLAPTMPLEAGAQYTVAVGSVMESATFWVSNTPPDPRLARVWPLDGGSATATFAVWCGDTPLPEVDVEAVLEPSGPAGRIRRGAIEGGASEKCLRFEASTKSVEPAGDLLPPLSVSTATEPPTLISLDPRPLRVDGPVTTIEPVVCSPVELPFGPGCVTVEDDRILGRAPAAPVLWAIVGAGVDTVFVSAPNESFVVANLPPSTDITLDVAAIDNGGGVLRSSFAATTAAPRTRLVLNEVLADPLGLEPAQEWIEIVNDGASTATLEGYVLVIAGATTPLPPTTLAAGSFALIVNQAFVETNGVDRPPAQDTQIIRVPRLGARGLSNSGQVIVLMDAAGTSVSQFPATPKPRAGESVARRLPSAPDMTPSSFDRAQPSPGRTNVW